MRGHLRALARRPGFVAASVTSVALAVGATSAAFSLSYALWLRPSLVHEPHRIVVPYLPVAQGTDGAVLDAFPFRVRPLLDRLEVFDGITFELARSSSLARDWTPVVRLADEGRVVEATAVAANYFAVLGVPLRGRGFVDAEGGPGGLPVAIVSAQLWRTLTGGRSFDGPWEIATARGPLTVVGVAPEAFRGARLGDDLDLWLPFGTLPAYAEVARDSGLAGLMPVTVMARLGPSVSASTAEAQLRTVLNPAVTSPTLRDVSFAMKSTGALTRQVEVFTVLWIVAGLVVLLGCVNLATLLIAKGETLRNEFALRLALGATPRRIVGGAVLDATLLAAAGTVAGLLIRGAVLLTIHSLVLPGGVTVGSLPTALDASLVAFAALVALLSVVVAGASPLAHLVRVSPLAHLPRVSAQMSSRTISARQMLLGAHVLVTTVLLVFTVTFAKTVIETATRNLGFDRDRTLFLTLRPRLLPYLTGADLDVDRLAQDTDRLIREVRAVPDVQSAALGSSPLSPDEGAAQPVMIRIGDTERRPTLHVRVGGPGYLTTLGTALVEGRDFLPEDASRAPDIVAAMDARFGGAAGEIGRPTRLPAVAVIDRRLAESWWPGASALGRTFSHGGLAIRYEVAGVVQPIDFVTTEDVAPTIFLFEPKASESRSQQLQMAVRTRGSALNAVAAVEAAARRVFPDPSGLSVQATTQIVQIRTSRERLGAALFSWFGVTAAMLATVGTYGLVAFVFATRRRELGIRLALGASPFELKRLTILAATTPVLAGIVGGWGLAWLGGRIVEAAVGGLAPADATVFVAVAVLEVVGALGAAAMAVASMSRLSPREALGAD